MSQPQKKCFGLLEKVFPMGKEGLRQVPGACLECAERVNCLKAAMYTKDGISFRAELLNRSEPHGLMAHLKRWSERKGLDRLMKEKEGKKK